MNNRIAVYGFTEEQLVLLTEHIPDGYVCKKYDDAAGLIGSHCICNIICSENLDAKSRKFLDSFYLDVGENVDEQVIWIDSQTKPPVLEGVYFHYNNLEELLPELDEVLIRAQQHYAIQQMYCGAYAFLPELGVEEMLEEELWDARKNKYGREPEIFKRVRQEWTALLEVDAITELAAVYEFSAWLKHNKHPFRLGGTAVCGMIPYLLDVHDVNPLPPHLYCPECQKVVWNDGYKDGFDIPSEVCSECGGLMQGDGHNLIWQEYASYGSVPTYVFYLPYDMKPLIFDWLDSHWLRKYMGDQWEAAQPYENHLVRGNMHFRFELDRDEISPDFYSTNIGANCKAELIQLATNDEYYHRNPYPKDMGELLTQLGIRKTVGKEDEVARNILLQNKISWRKIPSCREEVFFYLKEHDFIDKDAFRGMNCVRKGKGLPVVTEDMQAAEDRWKAEYFNQIDWMPSKAMLLQRLFFEFKKQKAVNRMDEIITELYKEVKNNYISAWKYDFLLTDEFLSFFTNQKLFFADHSKMALGAAHLGYSDTTNKFELAIRDYLLFEWLDSEVNKTERIDFSALWKAVRDRYNANSVDQNLEQLLQEDAEKTSPDEIVAAIIYCTIGAERLCTGFFASCCENGMTGRLLLRLLEIRELCKRH